MANVFCNLKYFDDINVSELCDKCGISRTAYYKLLKGSIPRLDTAYKIAEYLHTCVEMIWTYETMESDENPYCKDCIKESCIDCDINNYGHPLYFDD